MQKSKLTSLESVMRIALGCGSQGKAGFINVDWIDQKGVDVVHNLLEFPYPFDDGVADYIELIDVLEHMPSFTDDNKSFPIEFVNECWRILKVGGELVIQVPHWQSPNTWIDPTHVRGYDMRSMDYFDPSTDLGRDYGYYSDHKFMVAKELTLTGDGAPNNVIFKMCKL